MGIYLRKVNPHNLRRNCTMSGNLTSFKLSETKQSNPKFGIQSLESKVKNVALELQTSLLVSSSPQSNDQLTQKHEIQTSDWNNLRQMLTYVCEQQALIIVSGENIFQVHCGSLWTGLPSSPHGGASETIKSTTRCKTFER